MPVLEKVVLRRIVIFLVPLFIICNTIAKYDHLVGHDFGSKVSLAIVVFPTPGLESTLNVDLLSPGKVLIADLGKVPPRDHVEPFCLFASLTIR
jgi:hypothetical protein